MLRRRLPLVAIVLAYIALALGYNLSVPVGESPDEPTHLAYVTYLRQHRALPHLSPPGGSGITQGGHPPLYYALAAALTLWAPAQGPPLITNPHFSFNMERPQAPNAFVHVDEPPFPYSGHPELMAVHVMRLISLAAGVIVILATYATARAVLARRRCIAWGAAGVVAFLPGFAFFGGVFNNDSLASAWAALGLLLAVRAALGHVSRRDLVVLGVVLGLGMLTKMTTIAVVGVAAVGVVVGAWRAKDWRIVPRAAVLSGVPLAVLVGWWIARNIRLYGIDDPMAWKMFLAAGPDMMRTVPLRDELGAYWTLQLTSFWGSFGWTTIHLPARLYAALAATLALAGAGLVLTAARWRRLDADGRWGLALLGLASVVGYLSVFRLAFAFDMVVAHGRYLYPSLAAMAVLYIVGLAEWWPVIWRRWVLGSVVAAFLACSVGSLLWLVRPAFAPVPVVGAEEAARIPHPLAAEFAGGIHLRGYALSADRLRAGSPLTITLYWQSEPEDRLAPTLPLTAEIGFVHLLGADGEVVARTDAAPFGGRYPLFAWRAGDLLRQDYELDVSVDAVPGRGTILVGWYPEDRPGDRLAVTRDGRDAGDVLRIEPIVIEPDLPPVMDPAVATARRDALGDPELARLAAYEIEGQPAAGETVTVTLYWQSGRPIEANYTVFVHLTDASGAVVATGDAQPQQARYPTSLWAPGELVVDPHTVQLPDDLGPSPSELRFEVGWYDGATGQRVPARMADGAPWPDQAIVLAR